MSLIKVYLDTSVIKNYRYNVLNILFRASIPLVYTDGLG